MEPTIKVTKLVEFLEDELAISSSAIAIALRNRSQDNEPIPMLLWQYGLVNREQLTKIFDWVEHQKQFQAASWLLSNEFHHFMNL